METIFSWDFLENIPAYRMLKPQSKRFGKVTLSLPIMNLKKLRQISKMFYFFKLSSGNTYFLSGWFPGPNIFTIIIPQHINSFLEPKRVYWHFRFWPKFNGRLKLPDDRKEGCNSFVTRRFATQIFFSTLIIATLFRFGTHSPAQFWHPYIMTQFWYPDPN